MEEWIIQYPVTAFAVRMHATANSRKHYMSVGLGLE